MKERRSTSRNETPTATVGRVIALLNAFVEADGDLGITELSDRLTLAKSVVHRLVAALSKGGYLSQNPNTRRYSLGPGATRLGQAALGQRDIRALARPLLTQLAAETGETATLSLLTGEIRVYAEQVESTQAVRQSVQIGTTAPLYVGASGKAILANLTLEQGERILKRLARTAPAVASGARLNVLALKRDLEIIRRRGFAVSEGERVVGAASASAAVFGAHGEVIGSLSVASVTVRHDKADLVRFGLLARGYADRLSLALGAKVQPKDRRPA